MTFNKSTARRELQTLLNDTALVPDPYPLLAWLRANDPLAECNGLKFVTRFDDVVSLYRNPQISRHLAAVAEAEAHTTSNTDEISELAKQAQISMLINQDEPAHLRIRQILEAAFHPNAVIAWQPRIEAITAQLIARVRGMKSFDLLAELAYPLPERVICELMGVPHADHALWSAWTNTIVASARTKTPTSDHAKEVGNAIRNFYLYLQKLVRARKSELGDDLVSVLIRAENEGGGRLSEVEAIGTIQMLISAGHETTANLIGNGMHALLSHPDQYAKLRSETSLIPNAVEEMLRFSSPAHWSLPRVALTEVGVTSGTVPAGCPMIMSINAANRDPAIFSDPETLDISRKPNRHIAFAVGPHFCLGARLARQEAQAMVRAIVTQLPKLELHAEPKWKTSFVRALESLPVRVAA